MMEVLPDFVTDKISLGAYRITLRHLLTLSDRIASSERDFYFAPNGLTGSFRHEPAVSFFYNDPSAQGSSVMTTKTTGSKAEAFAREHLLSLSGSPPPCLSGPRRTAVLSQAIVGQLCSAERLSPQRFFLDLTELPKGLRCAARQGCGSRCCQPLRRPRLLKPEGPRGAGNQRPRGARDWPWCTSHRQRSRAPATRLLLCRGASYPAQPDPG